MVSNVKLASAMIGSVMMLGVIEHLCCILNTGHHHEEGTAMSPEDHVGQVAGHAADMLRGFVSKYKKVPCVKVASVQWVVDADRNVTDDEITGLPHIVQGLFTKSMLHSVHAVADGYQVTVSFEVHDGSDGPMDMSAVESSLCTAGCQDLLARLRLALPSSGWTPLRLAAFVKVDASASVGPDAVLLHAHLFGKANVASDAQRALDALWLYLARNGHRSSVTIAENAEGGDELVVPVEVRVETDAVAVEALMAGWSSEGWRTAVVHTLDDDGVVIP